MQKPKYSRRFKERVLKLQQQWLNNNQIIKETWIELSTLQYMQENLRSFRQKTIDWVVYKKCKNCQVYRIKAEYPKSWIDKNWTIAYKSNCVACSRLIRKNKRLLWEIDKEKVKERTKKCRQEKESWFYYNRRMNQLKESWLRNKYLKDQRIYQRKYRDKKRMEKINLILKEKRNEWT